MRSKPELCYTTASGTVEGVASYRGAKLHCTLTAVVVAEWLRRQTRNLLGSARAGSNPADYAFFSPSLFVCLPYVCNLYTLFLLLHPLFKISSFSFNLPLPPNPFHWYAGFLSPVLCCTCTLLQFTRARQGPSLNCVGFTPRDPDDISLSFESRFESGNLSKAVQVYVCVCMHPYVCVCVCVCMCVCVCV